MYFKEKIEMRLNRTFGVWALIASICFVNFSQHASSGTTVHTMEIKSMAKNINSEFRADKLIQPISYILFPVSAKIINLINSKVCLGGLLCEIYPGLRKCNPHRFRANFCLEFKTPHIAIETRTVVKE